MSLQPGDGDTAKQEPQDRRVYMATWEAVNPSLTLQHRSDEKCLKT